MPLHTIVLNRLCLCCRRWALQPPWVVKRRLDAEEKMLRLALPIEVETHGAEHLNTATMQFELAKVLQNQGQLGEAEKLLHRARVIFETVLCNTPISYCPPSPADLHAVRCDVLTTYFGNGIIDAWG